MKKFLLSIGALVLAVMVGQALAQDIGVGRIRVVTTTVGLAGSPGDIAVVFSSEDSATLVTDIIISAYNPVDGVWEEMHGDASVVTMTDLTLTGTLDVTGVTTFTGAVTSTTTSGVGLTFTDGNAGAIHIADGSATADFIALGTSTTLDAQIYFSGSALEFDVDGTVANDIGFRLGSGGSTFFTIYNAAATNRFTWTTLNNASTSDEMLQLIWTTVLALNGADTLDLLTIQWEEGEFATGTGGI